MELFVERKNCRRREKRITKMIKRVTAPLTMDDATEIYWDGDNSTFLCRMLGVKNHELLRQIGKPLRGHCEECGDVVFWQSVTEKKRGPITGRGLLCVECDIAHDEQRRIDNEAEWEERRTQEQRVLHILKTMPYAEYLRTVHWDEIRRGALRRARYRCQLCNKQGVLHVHHRTYDRRGEERWNDVIVLCANCHGEHHGATED